MKFSVLILNLLCYNFVLTSADYTEQNGHCDSSEHSCDKHEVLDTNQKRYLLYDVNPPEGFNLRRDVYMRFAIMLVQAIKQGKAPDWHLVLPPWYNIYHWKTDMYNGPRPWGTFFDLASLKNYAPVMELYEVMGNVGLYGFKIDNLYVLQNYENAFENGVFEDKWDIVGPCQYEQKFWDYNNITAKKVTCVQFQGSISKLWEIIEQHPEEKRIMFAHGEIPLHDSYGTKSYWDCRKSMVPNRYLQLAADEYIIRKLRCFKLNCDNYLAIHWRRQDFLYANRGTSIKSTAKQIYDTLKKNSLQITNIFIATDSTVDEFHMLRDELASLGLTTHFYVTTRGDTTNFSDGQIAMIDQIICARAAYFIGTHESTFTYRIQEEREILRFKSNTTFNTFCPDVGKCEKPARWTIVD